MKRRKAVAVANYCVNVHGPILFGLELLYNFFQDYSVKNVFPISSPRFTTRTSTRCLAPSAWTSSTRRGRRYTTCQTYSRAFCRRLATTGINSKLAISLNCLDSFSSCSRTPTRQTPSTGTRQQCTSTGELPSLRSRNPDCS